MIRRESLLRVADNSGVNFAKCINSLLRSRGASVGDRILISVKEKSIGEKKISNLSLEDGDIFSAVVVRTKKSCRDKMGIFTFFGDNALVLLNQKGDLLGTRLFGPLKRWHFENSKYKKFLALASNLL